MLGAAFASELTRRAPLARVRFRQHSPDIIEHAVESLRSVDLIWIPHGFLSDLPHLDLYTDRWMCIADAANDAIADELTIDHLRTLPWVVNYRTATAYTPATRQMELLGIDPRIEVVTESFTAIPDLVAGTGRIALLQNRLACQIPADAGIRVWDPPFDAVPLVEAAWWHPLSTNDVEHRFLRSVLADAARATT